MRLSGEEAFSQFKHLFYMSSKGKRTIRMSIIVLDSLAGRVSLSISDSTEMALHKEKACKNAESVLF